MTAVGMENKVMISTGFGRLHLYHAARAAQHAGYLHSMVTTFYLREKWLPFAERIAQVGGNRFRRLLLHRDPDIDEHHVVSLIAPEILCRFSSLLTTKARSESLQHFLDCTASQFYGRLASQYIRPPVKVVHSRSGFSRYIIPKAHAIGAKVILEQSAAHPDFVRSILEEEYEQWEVPQVRRTYVRPVEEMRRDIRNSDFILTNSEFCASTVRPHVDNPDNVKVVYTGVDTDRFSRQEGCSDSTFRILFVGSLSTFKGVVYLVNAFKRLGLHNTKLILVGNYHIDCPKIVYQLRDFYEHVPHVPHQDMPVYYARASVFVFPSLAEGSAKVVGEAMASGLPCIVTPNSGSVIRDGIDGFVVPTRDEDALADRILRLYEDPDLRHGMGRAARQRVLETLTWEHFGQNLLKVYEEIAPTC